MSDFPDFVAFENQRRLAEGTRAEVAAAVRRALRADQGARVLAFATATGAQVDFDPRDTAAERDEPAPRGRGRPKLGVVAREVTLLPRHWEWLAAQPGGASVALRRLVDEARRTDGGATQARQAVDAAYRFFTPSRAIFPASRRPRGRCLPGTSRRLLESRLAAWPPDIVAFRAPTPGARRT